MKIPRLITSPRRSLLAAVIVSVTALASAPSTHAVLISPVSATTDMGSGSGTQLINTINGVGLSSLSLTATHLGTGPGNSWIADRRVTGIVTFDLGSTFSVDGFSFWNQNATGPGQLLGPGSTGIQDVAISYSTDNITFLPLLGAPTTFARETAHMSTAQQFSFGAVNANLVRFSIMSNYGDVRAGFAEIQFNRADAVPDLGSTFGLLGFALLGLVVLSRKTASLKKAHRH